MLGYLDPNLLRHLSFFLEAAGSCSSRVSFFWKEDLGLAVHKSLMGDAFGMSPSFRFPLGCERFGQCCPHPACKYFKADIVGSSHLALISFSFTVD